MATADQEIIKTWFTNSYLRCDACGRRAVAMVGAPVLSVNLVSGLVTVSLPASGRNWPCYDVATRTSVCDNWTSTTGCQHSADVRAQHANNFTFEGTRK